MQVAYYFKVFMLDESQVHLYAIISSLSLHHYANAEYLITKHLAQKLGMKMPLGSRIVEFLGTILGFPMHPFKAIPFIHCILWWLFILAKLIPHLY